jgi:hypothetical protein
MRALSGLLRLVASPVAMRLARRYPGVVLGLAMWRWWRRRSEQRRRHVITLRHDESIVVERRRGAV